jgi:hypothetical protein
LVFLLLASDLIRLGAWQVNLADMGRDF